jgi:Tfp pilus assembly protein PilV
MALRRGSRTARPEAGFALIEVVVSALIMVSVTGGVIKLLNVSGHAGSEQRHRSQAYSIAQEDQARMRGMQIPSLNNYSAPNQTVPLGGTNYKVSSSAKFVNDKTADLSCQEGAGSADYVRIRSEVTWPSLRVGGKAVVAESIVTPPSGSLDPTHGTLVVSTVNAEETPISAVLVKGTGPTSLTGSTDSTGCVIFPDIPEGNYSVIAEFPSGYVNKDGEGPKSSTVGVVGGATVTKTIMYDRSGAVPVNFKYRVGSSGTFVATKADAILAFNTGMTTAAIFGTPGGTRQTTITSSPLFPFPSADTIYAGSCTEHNPGAGAGSASVLIPSGTTTAAVTLQLPALEVDVWTGSSSSNKGSAVNNAHVVIADDKCLISGQQVKRSYTLSSGALSDPGLPTSTYDICADNGSRRQTASNVAVTNLANLTIANVYLTASNSSSGVCS